MRVERKFAPITIHLDREEEVNLLKGILSEVAAAAHHRGFSSHFERCRFTDSQCSLAYQLQGKL